ncbi:MAG: hypothetical protein AW07_02995 [Candidatus Accumulibacter sp. SK-11]|nr:MAG: hypothetical protein AW07_02995 [Candidatus Accumulibacter sp. SK-11]
MISSSRIADKASERTSVAPIISLRTLSARLNNSSVYTPAPTIHCQSANSLKTTILLRGDVSPASLLIHG